MHTATLAHKPTLLELLAEPECFRVHVSFLDRIELDHYGKNFISGSSNCMKKIYRVFIWIAVVLEPKP